MPRSTRVVSFAAAFAAILWAVGAVASLPSAQAQSANLALCDRVAADPADPDKPAAVAGVREIAPSDVATAIKYCRGASSAARRPWSSSV
jgi:hypothetical protein